MLRVYALVLLTAVIGVDAQARPRDQRDIPYPPGRAVGVFSSATYAVTFPAPARTFYCPVPDDWTGSDHGTILFLIPPKACHRPGFTSSSRGFEPQVPHIEVFYALDVDHDPPSCASVGRISLLGSPRPLCRTQADPGRIALSASAKYETYGAAELDLTLVTTPGRLARDLPAFRRFAASVRACKDHDASLKGPLSTWGSGPPCPESSWY